MNNNLPDLIKNFGLTEVEKSFWTKRAESASDAEKEAYFLLFQKYPEDLPWITKALMRFEYLSKNKHKDEYLKLQSKVHKKLEEILDKN